MNYPKSNTLRLIEGDRGHRTKEQKEKDFFSIPSKKPHRPSDLSKESRVYWKKYIRIYRITEADVPLFGYLCQLVQEIKDVEKVLIDEGRYFNKVSVDGAGVEHIERKEHPGVNRLDKLRKEKRILDREFSRRYLPINKKDDVEELIN